MTDQSPKTCTICEGTGKQLAMKSWFAADGFRRVRCGICAGSGRSSYTPDPDHFAQQKRLRALAA